MSVYPVAYVGMPITADFWNQGQENWTVKGGDTSRVNSTLADDPDLSGIALPVGQIYIKIVHLYRLASNPANNSTVGYKTALAFTGTATGVMMEDGPSNNSGETAASANSRSKKISGSFTTSQTYGAFETFNHILQHEAILNVTVAGNLSLQWAQGNTVGGNALTLGVLSSLMWKQIG